MSRPLPRRRSRRAATAGVRDNDRFHVRLPMNGLSDWSRYTDGMDELSVEERVRRVISSADLKRRRLPSENRGDQIQRACLSACQILKVRSDGRDVRLNKEPAAPDYPVIRARLNRQWREQQVERNSCADPVSPTRDQSFLRSSG